MAIPIPGKRTKLSRFPGSFFLYNSYEGLSGNQVLFVLLSKCFDKKRTIDTLRAFSESFFLYISYEDFPENRVEVPGMPIFLFRAEGEEEAITLVHIPAMNPKVALAGWM